MTKPIKTRILLTLTVACIALPMTAHAAYRGNSDTGFQHLDFIENERREERANRLTPEQEKLLADVAEMAKHLRHPPSHLRAMISPMTNARESSRQRGM